MLKSNEAGRGRSRRREALVLLGAAAALVFALLAVFAIELSNTQAKSKRDVEARVHERAVLAAALIDSLFASIEQQLPQTRATYGGRIVRDSVLDAKARRGQNLYLALLDRQQHVLAHSSRFTAQARSDLAHSAALALIRTGRPYALGNVLPYGRSGVINFAVEFPTAYGPRILLTGLRPKALGPFITGELTRIPGPAGAHNYLLDANQRVVASTNPSRPPGYVFNTPSQLRALALSSGDANGYWYDQVPLTNSSERILLADPNGPLFASVSGLRKWIPWLIFVAFALFAAAALALGRRSLRSADEVRLINDRLENANQALEASNQALGRRAQELARSNAELEQFASIASHDLQEPLRKVRTFAQQVTETEGENLSEKGHDYLVRANSAAARMQRLIEDLLKFSRVATHGRPFSPVDLDEIVHEVLDDLDAEVQDSGAHVQVGQLPKIDADPLQVRQLLQNLISNALKFRRPGVTPEVSIDASKRGNSLELSVRDNGIGFEPQYSHRIFRVFERLHGRNEYPGTGIGLALCRKIAERHGGTITATSVPGSGATFTVTMPVRQSPELVVRAQGLDSEPELVGAGAS